jgi:hypothetical protein
VPQKLGEPKIKEVAEIKEPPVKLGNNVGKGSSFCHLTPKILSAIFNFSLTLLVSFDI